MRYNIFFLSFYLSSIFSMYSFLYIYYDIFLYVFLNHLKEFWAFNYYSIKYSFFVLLKRGIILYYIHSDVSIFADTEECKAESSSLLCGMLTAADVLPLGGDVALSTKEWWISGSDILRFVIFEALPSYTELPDFLASLDKRFFLQILKQ